MKSRITIEVDFDNPTPYIKVKADRSSEDVRDKLVSYFMDKLGMESSWCKVRFPYQSTTPETIFEISPITPHQLKEEAEIMAEQARLRYEFENRGPKPIGIESIPFTFTIHPAVKIIEVQAAQLQNK